jgi:hypothetical protein
MSILSNIASDGNLGQIVKYLWRSAVLCQRSENAVCSCRQARLNDIILISAADRGNLHLLELAVLRDRFKQLQKQAILVGHDSGLQLN